MTEVTEKQKRRPSWRGHHTVAASIVVVAAMVFAYAGVSAASTITRAPELDVHVAELVTVSDVSYLVTNEGQLYSQGLNNTGQLGLGSFEDQPEWQLVKFPVEGEQPKIQKVSSYGEHAIALDSNGGLWTWGDSQSAAQGAPQANPNFSPVKLSVSYSFSQLQTGDDFAVALDSRGVLYSWGSNGEGQLGTGSTESTEGPTLIAGGTKFASVAAGSNFAFAIDSAGALWAWGSNDSGQFGNGTKDSSNVPIQVSAGPWAAVYPSRFSDTVLAISRDGQLYSWGPNDHALLGNNRDWRGEQAAENKRVEDEKARIKAEDDQRRAELVATKSQAVLDKLVNDWTLAQAKWVLARDAWLQANPEPKQTDFVTPGQPITPEQLASYEKALGDWNTKRSAWLQANPEPQRPTSISDTDRQNVEAEVTAEFKYTDTSGIVPAVIKEPEIGPESLTPGVIRGEIRFRKASVGSENAFALDDSGRLWGWGNDKNGQTGLNLDEGTHTHAPVLLGEAKYNDVFAGPQWATAVSDSGVYSWGVNDGSNRLISAEPKLLSPTQVSNEGFNRVTGSSSTGAASKNDGTTSTWGNNAKGYSGQETGESAGLAPVEGGFQTVAFSEHGVLALSQGVGNLYFWGSDESGISSGDKKTAPVVKPQRQVIPRFVDVAAGRLSTTVLDSNGFVWTWGLSWMGNLGVTAGNITSPTQLPIDAKVTKLVAAQTNVLLVTSDNKLIWWGANSPGFSLTEIAIPEGQTLGKVTQLAAMKDQFLVLDETGAVWEYYIRNPQAQLTPVKLPGKANFIAAGGGSKIALVEGVAYGWGDNSSQQLIPKGETNYWEPTELPSPPLGGWKAISVSATHTVAVSDADVLYGWGHSNYIGGFGATVSEPAHIRLELKGE